MYIRDITYNICIYISHTTHIYTYTTYNIYIYITYNTHIYTYISHITYIYIHITYNIYIYITYNTRTHTYIYIYHTIYIYITYNIYIYITYNICTKIHIRIITECSVNRRHGSLLFARAKACPLTANSTFNMMEAATVIYPRNWGGAGYEWRCWFSQLRFGDIWSRCTVGVLFFHESLVLVWHFMEVGASLQDELCLQLRMENLLYVVVVKWERSSCGQDRTNGCIYI